MIISSGRTDEGIITTRWESLLGKVMLHQLPNSSIIKHLNPCLCIRDSPAALFMSQAAWESWWCECMTNECMKINPDTDDTERWFNPVTPNRPPKYGGIHHNTNKRSIF